MNFSDISNIFNFDVFYIDFENVLWVIIISFIIVLIVYLEIIGGKKWRLSRIFLHILIIFAIFSLSAYSLYQYLENLKVRMHSGICWKTGENLYQKLGQQQFYLLAKKSYLNNLRKAIKQHNEKHWEICEKIHCGFYYFGSLKNSSDLAFIERFKEAFRKTSYYNYDGKLVNQDKKVLFETFLNEKLDLDKEIPYTEGVFLTVGFRNSTLFFFDNKDTYKVMPVELLDNSVINSGFVKRESGLGNFYLNLGHIMAISLSNDTEFSFEYTFTTNAHGVASTPYTIPVSNCGNTPLNNDDFD